MSEPFDGDWEGQSETLWGEDWLEALLLFVIEQACAAKHGGIESRGVRAYELALQDLETTERVAGSWSPAGFKGVITERGRRLLGKLEREEYTRQQERERKKLKGQTG